MRDYIGHSALWSRKLVLTVIKINEPLAHKKVILIEGGDVYKQQTSWDQLCLHCLYIDKNMSGYGMYR